MVRIILDYLGKHNRDHTSKEKGKPLSGGFLMYPIKFLPAPIN